MDVWIFLSAGTKKDDRFREVAVSSGWTHCTKRLFYSSSYLVCLSLNTNLMARSFIFSDLSVWPLLQKCHVSEQY